MMKNVDLSGPVLDDDSFDAAISEFLGMAYISPQTIQNVLDEAGNEPITLNINSGGGSVYAASAISDKLKRCKNEITTNISGLAASAASVIAMAGDKVMMAETGMLMIHNASSYAEGNNHDMQKAADTLEAVNQTIANAYISKTGKSKEEILGLMDSEAWITAEVAKEQGFVDEIFTNKKVIEPITNSVNGSIFSDSFKDKFQKLQGFEEIMEKFKSEQTKDNSEPISNSKTDKHNLLLAKKLTVLKG